MQIEVVALVMSCDGVLAEVNHTIDICDHLQEQLFDHFKEREEIFKLIVLTKTKYPLYTAANYFVISRSLLFSLLSVTTTYFIIVVQFNSK